MGGSDENNCAFINELDYHWATSVASRGTECVYTQMGAQRNTLPP